MGVECDSSIHFFPTKIKNIFLFLLSPLLISFISSGVQFLFVSSRHDDTHKDAPSTNEILFVQPNIMHIHRLNYLNSSQPGPPHHPCRTVGELVSHDHASSHSPSPPTSPHVQRQIHIAPSDSFLPSFSPRHLLISEDDNPLVQGGR